MFGGRWTAPLFLSAIVACSGDDDEIAGECLNSFPVGEQTHGHDHHDHEHREADDDAPVGALPPREDILPEFLSKTALYQDIDAKLIHPATRAYVPEYQLWSDGAEKSRWVYLPECETIDSSNMDDWSFPVGTQFFKEFRVDGRRIETRIILRFGTGPRDFAYASYLWNEEETEATRVGPEGQLKAKGTNHDIPSKSQCLQCHGTYATGGGRPSRGLGFSAIQLSHGDTPYGLAQLIVDKRLSVAPDRLFRFPGSEVERDALGTLHANCGNCHNDSRDRIPRTDLNLWVNVGEDAVSKTGVWRTAVGQANGTFVDQHVSGRIVVGKPDESSILYRMGQRGNNAQMPPIATHQVDQSGLAAVRAWVEGLQ